MNRVLQIFGQTLVIGHKDENAYVETVVDDRTVAGNHKSCPSRQNTWYLPKRLRGLHDPLPMLRIARFLQPAKDNVMDDFFLRRFPDLDGNATRAKDQ